MPPIANRVVVFCVAATLAAGAVVVAASLGTERSTRAQTAPPPDVAFMERTGLALRFVEHHNPLPVSSAEAAATGGRGAPAQAWLAVVVPAPNGATLPGLMRLATYVEKSQPVWFVIIDQEPDLGDADDAERIPWGKGETTPWFNVAFVDPYTGAYIIGLAGLIVEDAGSTAGNESTPPEG